MKTRKLRIKRKVVVKSRKKGKLNRKISYRRKERKSRNIRKKHNRTRKNRVMRGGLVDDNLMYLGKFSKKFKNTIKRLDGIREVDIWLVYHENVNRFVFEDSNYRDKIQNLFQIIYFSNRGEPKIITADEIKLIAYSELDYIENDATKVEFSTPPPPPASYKGRMLAMMSPARGNEGKTITFSDSQERSKFVNSLIEKITCFINRNALIIDDIEGLASIKQDIINLTQDEERYKEVTSMNTFSAALSAPNSREMFSGDIEKVKAIAALSKRFAT